MTTEKDIIRRNKRLASFFKFLGYDVQIYGSINNPAVILNGKTVLSCYVRNFYVIFTDAPRDGLEIFRHKLTHDFAPSDTFSDDFTNWMKNIEHRPCYSIQVKNTNLRLSGYNFLDLTNREETKYPVFSQHDFKFYFDKEYAEGIIKTYSNDSLQLELF